MTGRPIDRDAARQAFLELVRVTEIHRTRPADVTRIRLPLALEVLDHCGGDPIMALFAIAALVDPTTIPAEPVAGHTATVVPLRRLSLLPDQATTRRNAL